MSDTPDTDPLSGPIDDEPEAKGPEAKGHHAETSDETGGDDGSAWKLEPEPTEGEGPLP